MIPRIVYSREPLEPDVSSPPADRAARRHPEHRVWNYFTDATQQFFAGPLVEHPRQVACALHRDRAVRHHRGKSACW